MRVRWLIPAAAIGFIFVTASRTSGGAQSPVHRPVVIELFTSQGCSSCPPADRLLLQLVHEKNPHVEIIPLAYHVDYWDHLGWRDPFSARQWSDRQRDYAQTLHLSQVFTPQVIVNGVRSLVGSDEVRLRSAIEQQVNVPAQGQIRFGAVTASANVLHAAVTATLARSASHAAMLLVAATEDVASTEVTRGENAGTRLTSGAIVRWEDVAASVRPGETVTREISIPIGTGWKKQLTLTAFLQDRESRQIHTAQSKAVPQPSR